MNKERFMAYRDLRREVKQLSRLLSGMESRMFSPTGQRFTSTPHASSGKTNTMEAMVIRHLELKETFDTKMLELAEELNVLEKAVQTLTDPTERAIIRYRYFEGEWPYGWERICQLTNMSHATALRYHGAAMRKLKEYDPDRVVVTEDYAPDIYKKPGEDGYGDCDYCDEGCEQCDYCSTTEGCTVNSKED